MKKLMKIFRRNLNDHTLVREIEKIVKLTADSKKREEWSPFHWLPNVSSVKVNLAPWDEVSKKYGIKRRVEKAELKYKLYKNRKYNRYASHMIKQLRKSDQKRYWQIVDLLLRRSTVFFYLGLKHVFPKWHRDLPLEKVLNWYKKFRNIVACPAEIDFHRIYIEKANGKYRPLGVPSPVWRIYLHLVNQFLVLNLDKKISNNQHGFRPFKGTLTAWLDIIKNLNQYDNIYEFDYKGFFDNLKLSVIPDLLKWHGIPENWVWVIDQLNRSIPKLSKKDKIDEFKYRQIKYIEGEERSNELEMKYWNPIRNEIEAKLGINPDVSELRRDFIKKIYRGMRLTGVPQGAPTSPFLSILCLNEAVKLIDFEPGVKCIRYADDGIILSKSPKLNLLETEWILKEYGIEYNWEKSGWIKKNGKWLKPLKFLGLVYDGKIWKAETRKGSHLIYDKDSLLEALEKGYIQKGYKVPSAFEKYINSSFKGFILSRMYSGDWNLKDYLQDFTLRYNRGSWLWKYYRWQSYLKDKGEHKILSQLLKVKISVFNSSSVCIPSMLELLSEVRDNKGKKPKKSVRGIY